MWGYVFMLLSALAFASMGAMAHALGGQVDWTVIVLARGAVVLLLSGTAVAWAQTGLQGWSSRWLWIRSLVGTVALMCTFYAVVHLPVAVTLTLRSLYPLWVALLAWPLLHQKSRRGIWLAALVGVAGVALVQQPHFGQAKAAVFAGLGSSVAAAVVMIALHRLKDVDVRTIVFHYSIVVVVAAIGAIFLFNPGSLSSLDLSTRRTSLLLGVGLSAGLGQYFITKSLANGLPARVSVVGLTQVAFAIAFDVLIWQRTFSALSLVGIVLVLAPTGWILWNRPNANS